MKVSELSGVVLDYWVARAEGMSHEAATFAVPAHAYSTEWAYGGPIIERDQIFIQPPSEVHYNGGPNHGWRRYDHWRATVSARTRTLPPNEMGIGGVGRGAGETPLIAAMRAKVASHYGDDVPEAEKQAA
ncbi:phage protein NinX family protein [Paraburkholderia dilworthii]|uniref:phage protein NinX family protein n=1 Tax=Paraburkholderia dilworthii TaxID=948106 RepID=UPI0004098DA7|nr:phage protein NinX family protein [Paraburkholderia dilworthii]